MSDIYLILRRRLTDVTDWVELGTATLKAARKAKGYSYEAMGRQLSMAAKTWERWEKNGRVRRHMLPQVAEVLELEIDWPKKTPVTVTEPPARDRARIAIVEDELREVQRALEVLPELQASLARIEALLHGGEDAAQSG